MQRISRNGSARTNAINVQRQALRECGISRGIVNYSAAIQPHDPGNIERCRGTSLALHHGVPRPYIHDQRPARVYWEITRACDLACRHCRASAVPDRDPNELSHEQALALLERLAAF